jgi:hypothetical protein
MRSSCGMCRERSPGLAIGTRLVEAVTRVTVVFIEFADRRSLACSGGAS